MIDWFTVIAQIVNFLILVALLRHFLYRRILAAMDARDGQVAERWEEAEQSRQRAAEELRQASQKNQQLDERHQELLDGVREQVQTHRQELLADVRAEADVTRERWANALREEIDSFVFLLKQRAAEEILFIARKSLADLADVELEQQIVTRFVKSVEGLPRPTREGIAEALSAAGRSAVVSTTYQLSEPQQNRVVNALRRAFFESLNVQFRISPDLVCGIAFQTEAHTLAWDLRDYLATLEQQLQTTLEEEVSSQRSSRDASVAATG